MAREVAVTVPLPQRQTITLLLQAAEALQHQVVHFDEHGGRAEISVDFSFRSLATFRVHAEAEGMSPDATRLRLLIDPAFKLGGWTGVGQSERVGWQLIGKMQQILDPERYERLEDAAREAARVVR